MLVKQGFKPGPYIAIVFGRTENRPMSPEIIQTDQAPFQSLDDGKFIFRGLGRVFVAGKNTAVMLSGPDEKLIPGFYKGKKLVKRHQCHSVNMKVRAFGKGFTELIQLAVPDVPVG